MPIEENKWQEAEPSVERFFEVRETLKENPSKAYRATDFVEEERSEDIATMARLPYVLILESLSYYEDDIEPRIHPDITGDNVFYRYVSEPTK